MQPFEHISRPRPIFEFGTKLLVHAEGEADSEDMRAVPGELLIMMTLHHIFSNLTARASDFCMFSEAELWMW